MALHSGFGRGPNHRLRVQASTQTGLAVTEALDVAAFTGVIDHPGALSAVEAADTAAFTGSIVSPITGTLAATEPADVAAFVGTISSAGSITGALAATEAADTAAFAGIIDHPGTLAATEPSDVAAFAGVIVHSGALAATETADTAAFAGTIGSVTAPVLTWDGETADSTPDFNFDFDEASMVVGTVITWEVYSDSGLTSLVTSGTHTLTSPEITAGSITLGMTALADGSYWVRVKESVNNLWSNTEAITISGGGAITPGLTNGQLLFLPRQGNPAGVPFGLPLTLRLAA